MFLETDRFLAELLGSAHLAHLDHGTWVLGIVFQFGQEKCACRFVFATLLGDLAAFEMGLEYAFLFSLSVVPKWNHHSSCGDDWVDQRALQALSLSWVDGPSKLDKLLI